MSYGLKVWDAAGNLRLDVSDRVTRFLGSAVVSVSGTTAVYVQAPAGIVDAWCAMSSYVDIHSGKTMVSHLARAGGGVMVYGPGFGTTLVTVLFVGF